MSRSGMTWRGDQYLAELGKAADAAITQAAVTAAQQAAMNIGSESGGVRVGGKVVSARRGDKFKAPRGRQRHVASRPGDFPGYRTGHLARSMAFVSPAEFGVPRTAAYGTNVRYGRYLEYGTTKMQPRPWAMRTVRMAAPAMRAAAVASMRASMRAIARRFT